MCCSISSSSSSSSSMDTTIGPVEPSTIPSTAVIGTLPHNGFVSTLQTSLPLCNTFDSTLGRHLARRLVQIGVSDVFSVPGDFNLTLLDHLLAKPGLNLIGCCNELNAGYVADGFVRSRGVGACVVTFTVGGLSIINAIAGAYSENLPVICIVGGPNSNDYGTNRILHHTIGLPDFSQELRCFQTVTCYQAVVNNLEDAHELIDNTISTALKESKPVYISVSCNLPAIPYPTFSREPVPFSISPRLSNQMDLEAAVEAAVEFLNKAVKPVLVAGPKLRVAKASNAFVELANSCGYPVAVMPSAKGLVPENHPYFIRTYWGAVSTAFCAEIVESADAYLFAGPIFNDYSSVGCGDWKWAAFGCVTMKDFLRALSKRLKRNATAYDNYHRIYVPEGHPLKCEPNEPLKVNVLFHHIQKMLSSDRAVIVETGDSWFNCQKLKLPEGCGYEFQMQYGSIGWAVGATLGYAQAARNKRVIACIGDGSFQGDCTRCVNNRDGNLKPARWGPDPPIPNITAGTIIFLINNGGYTIEVEIHDGPYNVIKNWNYTGLWSMQSTTVKARVRYEEELIEAIDTAMGAKSDCLCFIEVIVHKDDTSKELLEWGSRVSAANS
ncbi:unnamed protein product [Camellia sinensis]